MTSPTNSTVNFIVPSNIEDNNVNDPNMQYNINTASVIAPGGQPLPVPILLEEENNNNGYQNCISLLSEDDDIEIPDYDYDDDEDDNNILIVDDDSEVIDIDDELITVNDDDDDTEIVDIEDDDDSSDDGENGKKDHNYDPITGTLVYCGKTYTKRELVETFPPLDVPTVNFNLLTPDNNNFNVVSDEEYSPITILPTPYPTKSGRNAPPKAFRDMPSHQNVEDFIQFYWDNHKGIDCVKNPFCTERHNAYKNQSGSYIRYSQILRVVAKMVEIPYDASMLDIYWNLVRPASLRKVANTLQEWSMTKQTMKNYIDCLYKLAKIINYKDFIDITPLKSISDNVIDGFIAMLRIFFSASIPSINKEGKESILRRRTHEVMQNQNRWIDIDDLLKKFKKEVDNIPNSIKDYKKVKQLCIVGIVITSPPGRTQNLKLFVVPEKNSFTDDTMTMKVKEYNKKKSSPSSNYIVCSSSSSSKAFMGSG